MKIQSLT